MQACVREGMCRELGMRRSRISIDKKHGAAHLNWCKTCSRASTFEFVVRYSPCFSNTHVQNTQPRMWLQTKHAVAHLVLSVCMHDSNVL